MPANDSKNRTAAPAEIKFSDCFAPVHDELAAAAQKLQDTLACPDEGIASMLHKVNPAGGKMIRSALVLLAGKLFAPLTEQHIETAAVVEMVHFATLLHDDVIDNAAARRGCETVNSIFGNKAAILLGDYVLSKAFQLSAKLQNTEAGKLLADTAVQVCRGEIAQNASAGNWHVTEKQYLEMARGKTAEFFSASAAVGAVLSGAPQHDCELLAEYGINIGMAFQVSDDLLDIEGLEHETGKTPGTDIIENKPTLPIIHYLDSAKDPAKRRQLAEQLINCTSPAQLYKILEDSAGIDYAKNYCSQKVSAARELLQKLTPAESSETADEIINSLSTITELICIRSY